MALTMFLTRRLNLQLDVLSIKALRAVSLMWSQVTVSVLILPLLIAIDRFKSVSLLPGHTNQSTERESVIGGTCIEFDGRTCAKACLGRLCAVEKSEGFLLNLCQRVSVMRRTRG